MHTKTGRRYDLQFFLSRRKQQQTYFCLANPEHIFLLATQILLYFTTALITFYQSKEVFYCFRYSSGLAGYYTEEIIYLQHKEMLNVFSLLSWQWKSHSLTSYRNTLWMSGVPFPDHSLNILNFNFFFLNISPQYFPLRSTNAKLWTSCPVLFSEMFWYWVS